MTRSLGFLRKTFNPGLHRVWWLVAVAAFIWTAPPLAYAGSPELMITPTRVVFEGRQRSAKVTLVNKGTQTVVFRVSLVNRRMTEDGLFEVVVEPQSDEKFADKMIRYAPRQVVLAPGRAQAVRLLVRKPRSLPPGEYRSHLMFRAVPPASAGRSVEDLVVPDGKFQIQLTVLFGITIPVIVRQGDLRADVGISDLEVEPGTAKDQGPVVSFRLTREGTRSVYGDIEVTHLSANGASQVVGVVRGIAVYTPNRTRMVRLPLQPPAEGGPPLRRLRITYRGAPKEGTRVATLDGEGPVLAQAEVTIPVSVAHRGPEVLGTSAPTASCR